MLSHTVVVNVPLTDVTMCCYNEHALQVSACVDCVDGSDGVRLVSLFEHGELDVTQRVRPFSKPFVPEVKVLLSVVVKWSECRTLEIEFNVFVVSCLLSVKLSFCHVVFLLVD